MLTGRVRGLPLSVLKDAVMLDYTAMGSCVLVLTLVTLLAATLLLWKQRSPKAAGYWFVSGIIGILLGAAGAAATVQVMGYTLTRVYVNPAVAADGSAIAALPATADSGGQGSDSRGPGGMGMGGGDEMGGPGMRGAGTGAAGNAAKRQLTTLVRKIHLLTGDIAITLTDDQKGRLAELLGPARIQPTMTDEQATALHDDVLAVLDDAQLARQESVALPRGGGAGGPGASGGPGPQDEDANPFQQPQNAQPLEELMARVGASPAEPATEPEAASPATDPVSTEAAEPAPPTAEEAPAEPVSPTTDAAPPAAAGLPAAEDKDAASAIE